MIRQSVLFALASLLATTALAQGISGVTRRTTTLEKQGAARRFLDGSGVVSTNGAPNTGRPPATGVARPAMAVRPTPMPRTNYYVARPAVARTNAVPATVSTTPATRPARRPVP